MAVRIRPGAPYFKDFDRHPFAGGEKVALITGGGTGLGAAVARRFSKSGAYIDKNNMTLDISLSAKSQYWVAGGSVTNFSVSPHV